MVYNNENVVLCDHFARSERSKLFWDIYALPINNSQKDLTEFIEINEFFNLFKKGNTTFIIIEKKARNVDILKLLEKFWDEKYEIAFHDTIHPTI